MNWFEELTGFPEPDYATVRERLAVDGHDLVVRGSSRRYGIGELELVSLGELRERAVQPGGGPGRARVRIAKGEVRQMHRQPQYAGALFQVASQFNLLEMVSPDVTPEDGVTRYQHDGTQGPACAIAAGAATIYRNYLVPVGDGVGQTRDRQLDGLADLGEALSAALDEPASRLWTMRNGYALCTEHGLELIGRHLHAGRSGPRRPALEVAHRHALAGGGHRPHRTATPEGVAGVLLGAARDVHAHSRPPVGALRAPRARSRLRGHLAGRGIASGARRHERRRAHAPGRRCIRQRRPVDRHCHRAGSGHRDRVRPRRAPRDPEPAVIRPARIGASLPMIAL